MLISSKYFLTDEEIQDEIRELKKYNKHLSDPIFDVAFKRYLEGWNTFTYVNNQNAYAFSYIMEKSWFYKRNDKCQIEVICDGKAIVPRSQATVITIDEDEDGFDGYVAVNHDLGNVRTLQKKCNDPILMTKVYFFDEVKVFEVDINYLVKLTHEKKGKKKRFSKFQ